MPESVYASPLSSAQVKKRRNQTLISHSVCHVEACHLEYLVDTFPEQTFINQAWSDTRLETRNSSGGVLVLGLNPSVAWGKSENIVPPFVPSIEDKRFCLRDVERIN